MATIRLKDHQWNAIRNHLYSTPGEHFAFMHVRWTLSYGQPVFIVHDISLIPDREVRIGSGNWEVETGTLIEIVNKAVRSKSALVEIHNHGGRAPRFSATDREGFQDFVPYVLDSLPGRPYAATVWGDDAVYGEFFFDTSRTGVIDSITVAGNRFLQIVSQSDNPIETSFSRQVPWFTEAGQRQLGRIRAAIVGAGGTGSQAAQALVFVGVRSFLVVDFDLADETNMNRLVTATAADIGTPKVILARRLIKSVAPGSHVDVMQENLRSQPALDALKGVDVIFGCVDNDGARLVLNELALAYRIPYFDIGVGIDATDGVVSEAGGQVSAVVPGGPCLNCMGLIDREEASYFLASPEEQEFRRAHGYVEGMDVPAPSVVSLNGSAVNAAVTEFAVYISGIRSVNHRTDLDLLGAGRMPAQWVVPTRVRKREECVQCALADQGDGVDIERYNLNYALRRGPEEG